MKKVAVGFVAIAAMIGTPVLGADMAVKLAVKGPPPTPAPVYSWTGFYVGGALGAKWADTTWTTTSIVVVNPFSLATSVDSSSPRDYDPTSLRIGGYVGYNYQFAPQWVAGIEGDWAYANRTVTATGIPGCTIDCLFFMGIPAAPGPGVDTSSVKMGWDASARVRLGYLISPNLLAYATGGIAWQRFEASATCQHSLADPICDPLPGDPFATATNGVTRTGWTIGGGLEGRIIGNWLWRAEYRYSDFGTWSNQFNLSLPGGILSAVNYQLKMATQIATLGLTYKFGP